MAVNDWFSYRWCQRPGAFAVKTTSSHVILYFLRYLTLIVIMVCSLIPHSCVKNPFLSLKYFLPTMKEVEENVKCVHWKFMAWRAKRAISKAFKKVVFNHFWCDTFMSSVTKRRRHVLSSIYVDTNIIHWVKTAAFKMTYQALFFLMFKSDSFVHERLQQTCLCRLRFLRMKYTILVLFILI